MSPSTATRCIREVALGTEHSEGNETKPLERTKREPPNIFKRYGKTMNPSAVYIEKVDVNHVPEADWYPVVARASQILEG